MRRHLSHPLTLATLALGLFCTNVQAAGINHLQAAAGPQNFFTTEQPGVLPHLQPAAWLFGSYAHDPLVCRNAAGEPVYDIIDHMGTAELGASFGLFDRLEVGVTLPGHFLKGAATPESPAFLCGGFDEAGVSEVNLGDPRFMAKVLLTPKNEGLVASFRLEADMPLAQFNSKARPFSGELFPNVMPALAVGYSNDAFKIGADVGYLLRFPNSIGDLSVGHEVSYGLGAEVAIIQRALYVTADVFGRVAPEALFGNSNQFPLEGALGLKYNIGPILLTAGAGTGIIADYGAPDIRGFFGIGYLQRPEKEVGDRDKDGILDPDDKCPDDPEDFDRFEDEDGCPDVDNDNDEILDVDDDCPDEPEDYDRWKDTDGCPDPDNDGDEILDDDDECPNDPEVYNEFEDEDGCPDSLPEDDKKVVVVVRRERIEIREKVFFEYDSDRILPKSYDLLDNVAKVISDHTEIPKILVEGHTDADGPDKYNLDLSNRRAASVKRYLVAAGVEEERLQSQGYGEEVPVAENDSEEGKAKNRRVEFKIVGKDGKTSDTIEVDVEPTDSEEDEEVPLDEDENVGSDGDDEEEEEEE